MTKPDLDLDTLVQFGRAAAEPSDGDRLAVRAGVMARLGVAAGATLLAGTAGAASGGAAGSASAAGVGTAAVKLSAAGLAAWFAAGGVLGGAATLAVTVIEHRGPAVSSAVVASARTAAPVVIPRGTAESASAVATSESALPPGPGTVADPGPEGPAERRPMGAKQRLPDAAPGSSASERRPALEVEARALAEVQRALRDDRPREALRLLTEQDVLFQNGVLGEERAAARVFALCATGDEALARALATRFLASHPASPVAERIRATCVR